MRKNPSFLLADNPALMDLVIDRVEKRDRIVTESILELKERYGKPIISGSDAAVGRGVPGNVTLEHLSRHNHFIHQTPLRAARTFANLIRYTAFRRAVGANSPGV